MDQELEDFVASCERRPLSRMEELLSTLLYRFLPPYEVHGLLAMYPMHLMSEAQWKRVVPELLRGGSLLDVGAGQGFVTERARGLFPDIVTAETSRSMVRRLRSKGFRAAHVDLSSGVSSFEPKSFDVISILNVLDRCARPRTLLSNAIDLLKDDGVVIVSDPLPIRQRVLEHGARPEERIATIEDASWERNLVDFYETAIRPAGLVPVLVTRLPYLSQEAPPEKLFVLDAFLMVCRKASARGI